MPVVHKHLIIRAETLKTPNDQKWAHTWLTELVNKIGMQICQGLLQRIWIFQVTEV